MPKIKKQNRLPYAPSPELIRDTETVNTMRYDDVYTVHEIGQLHTLGKMGSQSFEVSGDGELNLRIEVWSDEIIRFFYAYGAEGEDFSYARDPDASPAAASVEHADEGDAFLIRTAKLRLRLDKTDGGVTIHDRNGVELHRYTAPFYTRTTLMRGLDQMRLQYATAKDEIYYGLGDKAWDTNLHGRCFENWNSDAFAYGRERDALYRSIPFFYGLRDDAAYGVFVDNTYRSHFDFNSNGDGLTTVWTDGGDFDYYFIYGPRLDEVATRYAKLTGVPELPPLWALGYHQCRWSYYPEKRVKEVATTFREKNIPCDAIYLDIDYMDGYRCFTWNNKHFPDPKRMISELADDHFHTVVMIDPGIKVDEDYPVYTEGVERDAFCRRSTGERMVGPVWPQECVWPDYTNPSVREWWGTLYRELYVEQGVSGFWNDMNEPAMFKVNALTFPPDVRHDFDGLTGDHKKAHNIYGQQMTRASFDGLKELQPGKRPFLLARASFCGGQRYASLWTGDNIASWEHLAIANRQCIRMAISGYSFVGTDIGGFVDDPEPELLTRWLQLAVFHPLMRIHSMGNNVDGAAEAEADEVKKAERENRQDQEPWVHGGSHTDHNRAAIELRYQLLPYLYTAFRQHTQTGLPVLRNLTFYDQADPQCRKFCDQFIFGNDLLVCPVVTKGAKTQTAYLPEGKWYDYWTGKAQPGKQKVKRRLRPDRMPIFVRAGAVIPTVETVQHTAAMTSLKTLKLTAYLGDEGSGDLFWDAGEGYGYRGTDYTQRRYALRQTEGTIVLQQEIEGSYRAAFETIELRIVGLEKEAFTAKVDGKPPRQYDNGEALLLPFDFSTLTLR